MTWPFPPPGGPIPWTPKQIFQYKRQQREQQEQDRNNNPAPF